jgi:spore photoproduct lyase
LKSKAVCIDRLLAKPAPGNVVLSWSLNPVRIATAEERYAASIAERLAAAKAAVEHGYMVGFHFDPIIYHAEGEALYGELAEMLTAAIPAERIAWISLGCMRFPPELLPVVREHQTRSAIFSEEMIRGNDGKWRYPRLLRIKMYRWVWQVLNRKMTDVFTYMCMEKADVWREVFGWAPKNNTEFDRRFSESLKRRFSFET